MAEFGDGDGCVGGVVAVHFAGDGGVAGDGGSGAAEVAEVGVVSIDMEAARD